jgi:hypothetical protein
MNCGLCGFQLKLVRYELAKGGSDVREESQRPSNSENDAAPVPDPTARASALIYYGALGFIYIACIILVFTAFRSVGRRRPSPGSA